MADWFHGQKITHSNHEVAHSRFKTSLSIRPLQKPGMPNRPAQKMHNVVERVHEHPRRASATEDDHLMDHLLPSSETETCPRPIDSTSPAGNETTVKEDLDGAGHETAATATWQPKWLRSIVLGSFAAIFVFFAAALPLLLWYSERHHGILAARQSFVYIWRFGPTAGERAPSTSRGVKLKAEVCLF